MPQFPGWERATDKCPQARERLFCYLLPRSVILDLDTGFFKRTTLNDGSVAQGYCPCITGTEKPS